MRQWLPSILLVSLLAAGSLTFAQAQQNCEPLPAELAGGLLDFNDPANAATVSMVEFHHFTPDVENLVRGSTGSVPADLDFVLRKIPNHYRALSAMGRWQIEHGVPKGPGTKIQSADCYYFRAVTFRPDDAEIHQAYAVYLHRSKRYGEAEAEYSRAEALGASGPEFYANRGLLMIEIGNLAKAQEYATKAYELGYPLPGLRNKLDAANAKSH